VVKAMKKYVLGVLCAGFLGRSRLPTAILCWVIVHRKGHEDFVVSSVERTKRNNKIKWSIRIVFLNEHNNINAGII